MGFEPTVFLCAEDAHPHVLPARVPATDVAAGGFPNVWDLQIFRHGKGFDILGRITQQAQDH